MRFDDFLIRRFFAPIAHWIDYRFHRNNYDVAAACMSIACVLNVAVTFNVNLRNFNWFAVVMCVLFVFFVQVSARIATRASKSYEAAPDRLPAEAIWFHASAIVFWRRVQAAFTISIVVLIVLSIVVGAASAWENLNDRVLDLVGALWGSALYFAVVPKPPAKRKEQELPRGLALNHG